MKNDRAGMTESSGNQQSGSERDTTTQAGTKNGALDEIRERRERALDKTVADSFPTSDPPSSIPDPSEEDPLAA